jgi:uncharacterized coiled-coil DUF342 family protein
MTGDSYMDGTAKAAVSALLQELQAGVDESARTAVEHALGDLRGALEEAQAKLIHCHAQLTQAVEDASTRLPRDLGQAFTEEIRRVAVPEVREQAAEAATRSVAPVREDIASAAQDLAGRLGALSTIATTIQQEFGSGTAALDQRLAALARSSETGVRSIEAAVQDVAASVSGKASSSDVDAAAQASREQLHAVSTVLDSIMQQVGSVQGKLAPLASSDEVKRHADTMRGELGRSIESVRVATAQTVEAIRERSKELDARITAVDQHVQQVHEDLRRSVGAVRDAVSQASSSSQERSMEIQGRLIEIAQQSELIERRFRELKRTALIGFASIAALLVGLAVAQALRHGGW